MESKGQEEVMDFLAGRGLEEPELPVTVSWKFWGAWVV